MRTHFFLKNMLLTALLGLMSAAAFAATFEYKVALPKLAVTSAGKPSGDGKPADGGGEPATGTPPSPFSLSTESLTFGNTGVYTLSAPQDVLVTNVSGEYARLDNLQISGPFTATHSCDYALADGQSCVVRIQFAPTAVGLAEGDLRFITAVGTTTLTFVGNGVAN